MGFDVGESYAGLLPIGDANDTSNQMYFWFFPSTNPAAAREIAIWVTGGPGCSSTGELLQENGPFLWQPGTFGPIANKWSWNKLTNVVWIDQPIGSGFSVGQVTARDEADVARQFMGFWRNFVNVFALQGYAVYVTGSSYSGLYCPYIASAMLDADDKTFFNVSGMQIFDGIYANPALSEDVPVASFVDTWDRTFSFNDSFGQTVRDAADKCGYSDYMREYLVFPPAGRQPAVLPGQAADGTYTDGCDLFNSVFAGASELNPCFSVYEIAHGCPMAFDPLGFSSGTDFLTPGAGPAFFNRNDVKAAINAPNKTWEFCTSQPVFVNGTDNSLLAGPGSLPVLPGVIERTGNVILGHGSQDFVLIADGTLLAIQNMTWRGQMGFQTRPTDPLFVPYHDNGDVQTSAGAGVAGTVHSERGLTYLGVASSGHFLSMDAPAVAFRSLEVLLGRVPGFQSTLPFTTDTNATAQRIASVQEMGNGTVPEGFFAEAACAQANLDGSSPAVLTATTSRGAQGANGVEAALLAVAMLALTLALTL